MTSLHSYLKKLFHCKPALSVILLLIAIFRIPNFFEPYWYGDEAIYLTIGNAISRGALLYEEIVDHKTPLIYYFASVGSQLSFRMLLVLWMLSTTTLFYAFAKKLFTTQRSVIIATSIFALITTLPAFEGNIPNGELFVMGFVIAGLYILSSTNYFHSLFRDKKVTLLSNKNENLLLLFAGACMGLGILTKVPGILDLGAALVIGWFALLTHWSWSKRVHFIKKIAPQTLTAIAFIVLGAVIPIIISWIYYTFRGTSEAYLNFGLLYNFHYSGTWNLSLTNPIIEFFFTMPGKMSVLVLGMLFLSFVPALKQPQLQFIVAWTLLALFASLLSNRPYPHYFLQLAPPVALLVGYCFHDLEKKLRSISLITALAVLILILGVFEVLKVGLYPTISYYKRSWQLITGQMSYETYRNSFSHLMADNYRVAPQIMASKDPYLFIWGTNPTLYALTKKQPTGRFTVSFHIKDLKTYTETYWDFTEKSPEFVVVMKDEDTPLPGLEEYLTANYIPNFSYSNFVLWRKRSVRAL